MLDSSIFNLEKVTPANFVFILDFCVLGQFFVFLGIYANSHWHFQYPGKPF